VTPEELIDAWHAQAVALREFFDAQPMIAGWGVHQTEAFIKFKRAGMALQKFRTAASSTPTTASPWASSRTRSTTSPGDS
jgi:hypothetical protein